jgi:hypothetical protein
MNDNSSPSPAMASPDPFGGLKETAPPDDRLALIRAFQAQAMQRANPLAANLAVINGDLMHLVYRLRQALDESMTASPSDFPQLAQQAELLLRFVRQVDRLAQLDRQVAQAAEPSRKRS